MEHNEKGSVTLSLLVFFKYITVSYGESHFLHTPFHHTELSNKLIVFSGRNVPKHILNPQIKL